MTHWLQQKACRLNHAGLLTKNLTDSQKATRLFLCPFLHPAQHLFGANGTVGRTIVPFAPSNRFSTLQPTCTGRLRS